MLLRHLQYLTALARERHFARAAAACGVTQPTLSAGIKQLEEQLGLLVVQRGQRFEGLTAEGERVLAWAQRITADAEGLEQEASRLRQELRGRLRIGVVPTALPAMPILASPLARKYPGVRLTVVADPSVDIQSGLDEFRFAAGITYLDNEPLSRVRSIPLYREQYLLVTPAGGPLAGRNRVSWSEAATLPLCLLTPDMQNRRIVTGHFADAGVTVEAALETNSVFTLVALVRSGYWSSVLPYGFLPLLSGMEAVAILPLERPTASHTVGVVVSDREPLQPTATALLDVLGGLDWSLVAGPGGPRAR
jgi:DNA-binding transcriptional LysR family regulator